MNILYILGNGFDKAQGMATSYPDFYNYLKVYEGSKLLEQLKKTINANTKLWSDMEEAFGLYTAQISSTSDFISLYEELSDQLQIHLKSEESKFIPTSEQKDKFLRDFISPGRYLGELYKQQFDQYMKRYKNENRSFYVMTLNYTNTLEKLLSIDSTKPDKEKSFNNNSVLQKIIHVHGELGSSIIIGVDNEMQIANEAFRKDEDIKDWLIKIQSNHAMELMRHEECENLITRANLIILYGVSLGETDLRWWKIIGEELKKRDNIAIIQHLYKPNAIKATTMQRMGQLRREHINHLVKKMGLKSEDKVETLLSRMFFTVNADIFKK